jgi:YD repeat-containing protein
MVAIVGGNSLGLSLSSLAVLGQRGQLGTSGQGRSGEQSFVNIANGNLVLQDRDDVLMGRGLDVNAVRTYNSQGLLTDDNGDNWSVGAFGQKVVLTSGTVGTAGSTLTRTDRDGTQALYTWDATQSRYVSPAGSGAFDTIAHDSGASQFIWTDGDTGRIERYQSNGAGRLVLVTDTDGNTVGYAYNANGTVQSVTDANGDISYYDYSGTNLNQIRTVSGGVTATAVRYAYDASNRLSKVTVDLSPGDNTVADNDVYVTTYTYDGASQRVASVIQSDGTQLSFTYVQVGGTYKVATVTDALGAITRFAYDTAQNTTTVTDPLGAQSVYLYDAQGQLTQVRNGVTAANVTGLSQVSYLYDAQGNVTLVTDGEGHKVTLQYDDHGNLLKEVDSAGDTRVRTYNGANQLLTDTIYADAAVVDRAVFNKDAALPETTRYVYAAGNANRLRFAITPQGNVTEYRYDSYGQRTSAIKYTGAAYDATALALTDVPTEAQLSSWAISSATQDLTRTELTELVYDARGQLSSSTTYAATAANGQGVASTAVTTQYIYDQRGLLLQKIEPATVAGGATAVTTYTYDGLDRLLSVNAPSLDGGITANTTITSYDDTNGKTSVTIASGLVTVSAYDKAGRLVSVTQSSAGTGVLGATSYAYDKDGNLLMTQDPTGVRKWMLYDEADRKIADIDATGAVIEYVYNPNGQLRETIAYATAIGTANLVDGADKPTTAWAANNTTTNLDALRPSDTPQDQKVWRFYDTANRLAWQVDALGYVTQTTYDGASRILSVTQLANPIDVTKLGNGANIELLVNPATVGGVTLGVSPGTSPLGSAVTLTATIAGTSPGGMVTFLSGDTIIGSAPVINGTATLVTTELPIGTDSIRAFYSGDTQRPASISPVAQKTITGATTNAVQSFSSNPVNYGQSFTMSVALTTTQPPALAVATGEVKFYNGATLIGTASVINGLATLSTANLPVGSLSVRTEYSGDAGHATAVSTQPLTIRPNPTATTIQVSFNGASVNLVASVATALGESAAPSGTVTFYSGTTVVGVANLVNGTAVLALSAPLQQGPVKAVYGGDAINAISSSLPPDGTPSKTPTATTVSASAASGTQNDTITLTAQIAGAGQATGVVTFFSGKTVLGTATVVNGQATLAVNNLPVGVNAIQAAYTGDASNLTSATAQSVDLQITGSGPVTPLNSTGSVEPNWGVFAGPLSAVLGLPASVPVNFFAHAGHPATGTLSYFIDDKLVGSEPVPRTGFGAIGLLLGAHTTTVVYSGDAYYASGTRIGASPVGGAQTQINVAPATTAVAIASSRQSTVVGAPLVLTATVMHSPAYDGTFRVASTAPGPSGTVTFYNGATVIGTANVVNGVATLTIGSLPQGAANITAKYEGDANNAASTAPSPLALRVNASVQVSPITATLAVSQVLSNYGSALTLSVDVAPTNSVAEPAVSGRVDFYDGVVFLGSEAVVNGRASFTTSTLIQGQYQFNAVYNGDVAYGIGNTNSVTHQRLKAPTATTVSASAASGTQNDTITLTAQVAGVGATGVVTFLSGKTVIGIAQVVNGQAVAMVNNLPIGTDAIQATYSGDANNITSVASKISISITAGSGPVTPLYTTGNAPPPNWGLDVHLNGELGLPAHFSVNFFDRQPTGTLLYFLEDVLVGSTYSPIRNRASVPFGAINVPRGSYTQSVVYSGDNYYASMVSTGTYGSYVTIIGPARTTTTLTSSRPSTVVGAPLTLTAKIAHLSEYDAGLRVRATTPEPTGTVTFYSGTTVIGTATVVNGVATLSTGSLPQGAANITAKYEGDDSNAVSTSGVFAQQVVAAPVASSIGLVVSPVKPVYGSPVILTATGSGPGRPENGTVSFYDGATLLGSASLINGKASLSASNLEVGSHTIKVVYSGDANNAPSQNSANITVAKAPSTLTNLTAVSITRDGSLSVQVNGPQPSGLTSFYDGIRLLGTAQVVNGVATLSGVSLPPGTRTFTAAYAGDAHNTDSEVSFTQVVQGTPVTTIYASLDIQQDRTVTRFYNRDGQLQATLDGENHLIEYIYNAAGHVVKTIGHAHADRIINPKFTSAASRMAAIAIARASYNLQGLRPTDRWQAVETYNYYDDQGRLVGQVDGEGYFAETVYDTRGNVTQIIRYANKAWGAVGITSTLDAIRPILNDLQDQRITQTWSAANQLLSRTNAEGTVTQFAYNSVGQLVQTTTAAGTVDERINRALYDVQGRLISELDGRGSEAVALSDPLALWAVNGPTHTYDVAGRRTSTTDANGHRTLFFYDAIGRLRYTINALGEVTESRYSAMGQLTEQVIYGMPVNVVTLGAATPGGLNTATLAGQLDAVADATKDTHVLHTYNATGTQASTTDALGSVTSYSYNAFREASASSYALKSGYVVTDTASYDRRGLKIQTEQDSGTLRITQRRTYDAFGRVITSDDGNSNRTESTYDRLGRLVTVLDPTRYRSSETQYDAFDRVVRQRDGNGAWEAFKTNDPNAGWTSFSYNLTNRSSTVVTPEGVSVTTVRNRQGQTHSVTDARGNTTTYSYDKSGNLIGTSAPLSVSTSASYDKTGLKLTSTDANGVVTNYSYEAANRLLTRTLDPTGLNLVTTYGYDAKGQSVGVTDPKGVVTITEFDLAGRTVRQIVDPAGLHLTTSYTHDTTGKVLTVTDPNGNVTRYTYDGAGRRIKEQVDPSGLNLTRSYEYDAAGNVTRSIDANGNATRYAYDADNRLVFTLDALGNLTRQEFDIAGNVLRRTTYAVPIVTAGLSNAPKVAEIQTRIVVTVGSDIVENRRYDRDGRLQLTVDGTGAVVVYTYDRANNLVETRAFANRVDPTNLSFVSGPTVVPDAARDERVRTVYDQLNRATWRVNGAGNVVRYFYDANGNVTETLAYANALSGAAFNAWDGQSAPAVAADATRDQRIRSVYDTANRAIWSVDTLGGTTHYTYDADGNVAAKRSYATPLTPAALAAWDGRSAPAPVADDAHDQRARNVYDAANRLTWSVDGIGTISKTEYDANGNVTRRSQYATPVAEGADPASVTDSDADRVTDYLYDAGNRLRYQLRWTDTSEMMSGAGWMREVTSYDYDGVCHVVRQTAHAWPLLSYVSNDIDSVFGNLSVAPGIDQAQYMVYDAAGRLSWSVDGTGAVARNSYDGTGRVVRTIQYAQTVDVLGFGGSSNGYAIPQLSDGALQSLLRPDAAADRITAFAHDGAGRRTFTVDALGGVSRTIYDAFGNVTQKIGYANPIAAPSTATTYTYAALQGSVSANAGADRILRFAYDQSNRQVFAVDAQGGSTESVYDGLGQEVQTRRYAQAISTAGLSTTASVSDIRSRIAVDAANDRVSRQVFNAGGQKIYSIDSLGFVSKTDYDGLGQVSGTTQYALSIPSTTPNTGAAIAAAVVISTDDRSKSFQHDAVGRVVSSVDAMGSTESWTYDALDNKTSYTNAKGAVWYYEYDLNGHLLREISPQVELTAVTPDANGRLQVNAGSSGVGNVITVLTYDSFGNLRSRTEGAGRPEQRTTTYAYDQVGRQVKVIYPSVKVYNPANNAIASDMRTEQDQILFTETTYDALGNAIANRDVGGNHSYKTYDLAGRVAYEVDALGFATGYQRNIFGDAIALTLYGTSTGLAAASPASLSTAQVQGAVNTQDGANRAILTDYDRLGRGIEVREVAVYVHEGGSATAQDSFAGKTTRNTYNTFGELSQVALKKSAGTWTLSTNFYDRRGQQIASVDAMGYVTKQAFDGAGNTVMRIEYARAVSWAGTSSLAGWTGAVNAGGTVPTPVLNANDDRTTTTVYDRLNRKTSDTRLNVEYSTASNGTSTRGDLTTGYGYDAVGNLTSTTDAKGAVTTSYYDALGRVTTVAEPTRAGSDGASPVTPLTVFRRDAYGNVVLKTQYVNGADVNGNPLSPSAMPAYALAPNPEVGLIEGSPLWAKEGSVGYIASASFEGGTALYRINNTFFGKHLYTTSLSEYESWKAMPNVVGEGIQGYVATTPQPGSVKLYRLTSAQLGFVDVVYTTSTTEVEALTTNPQYPYVVDESQSVYLGGSATGPFDAQLTRYVGPLTSFMTGFDHLYLPDRKPVDAWSDADTVANTDRASYAQYDALGHVVQSTDAMGVNHYSAYNSQGLVAKDWQAVTGNDGVTRTLFKGYTYDALGHQTHVLEPGTATDNVNATHGGVDTSALVNVHPKLDVTPGTVPPGGLTADILASQPTGSVTLKPGSAVAPRGGDVRVEFDYIANGYIGRTPVVVGETGGAGDPSPGVDPQPDRPVTDTQVISGATAIADLAAKGVTLTPSASLKTFNRLRIYQQDAQGNWVLKWDGTQAQADGLTEVRSAAGPSAPVDTAMAYNGFGELVAKSVNGRAGEYFEYDNAGRLWRTNAGDGIDKIALYDLQGHQTADIRSAGQGRVDANLKRDFIDAQQAAWRTDLRRTDTTYDLLGRVITQEQAARREGQDGLSVGNDMLSGGVAASAAHGDNGWSGTNTVNLGWNGLAALGSGDVLVEISYVQRDAAGNDGPVKTISRIFNAAEANSGVSYSWSDDASATYGGVQRVVSVSVQKKDIFTNWQPIVLNKGFGNVGQSVTVGMPADASTGMQVQYRLTGSGGAWLERLAAQFGTGLRIDLSDLALGTYEYQVLNHAPGQSTATVSATGTWSIGPRPLATIGTGININAGAQTLEWQGPGGSDTQTVRIRAIGGAWVERAIAHPSGNDWSTLDLSGLGAGDYEYELLWRHAGDAGAYAHATGQFHKDASVPGTPATSDQVVPSSGLPHIDGVTVIADYPYDGNDEFGQPITVPAIRLPVMLPYLSSLLVGPRGSGILALQSIVYPDGLYGYYVPALSPGVYTYAYAYSIAPNVLIPTHHAIGELTVNGDGSISITDTTPAYQPGYTIPGTPGTPGTPPQYSGFATDKGPYPVSEDPMLGGRQISQAAAINGVDADRRPTVIQNVDRWGNVASITDPRSAAWKTTYRYNANNQRVRQVQPDADGNPGVDANGNIINPDAPVTQIYYDAMGRQVAVRDANGHVNGQEWDAGGNLVRELHADGNGVDTGVVSHAYNAFGNKVRTIDAEGRGTWFVNDKLGRLLKTRHEAVAVYQGASLIVVSEGTRQVEETNTWDQAGRKLSQTNGNGATIRYAYDLRSNLTSTTQAGGEVTLAAYDARNHKILEVDGNGALATWSYDYFGQLQGHIDIGGATYAYRYDNARQLTAQSSTRTSNFPVPLGGTPNPAQNLDYRYDAAGQLVGITDNADGKVTSYRYGLSGRRVRETTVQGGVTYQDNLMAYDALGRMRWVADTRAYIDIDYDKVGNRTHIRTHLNEANAAVPPSESFYRYDAMNRQTVVDAANAEGTVLNASGHRVVYDRNGNRMSDTSVGVHLVQQPDGQWLSTGGETTETYGYDRLNRLTSVTRDGVQVDARLYDGASRVVASGITAYSPALSQEYIAAHKLANGAPNFAMAGGAIDGRINTYNANGQLTGQNRFEYGTLADSTIYDNANHNLDGLNMGNGLTIGYDKAGNLLGYLSGNPTPGSASFTYVSNQVVRAEGYRTESTTVQNRVVGTEEPGPLSRGTTSYLFDANNQLSGVSDDNSMLLGKNSRIFVNDANGTALYSRYLLGGEAQRQLVVDGEVLGRYGEAVNDQVLVNPPQYPHSFVKTADFGFGYQPIDGDHPASAPGSYVVRVGDTLQAIAKNVYGDASLWYLIADANGVASGSDLEAGQMLIVPARLGSANNANTFRPYDPSRIVGDTNPSLMALPQDQDKGCGAVGQIIVAVISVVVAVYTGGIGGAMLGSVVGQAAGVAMGVQDNISLKQVALAGLSAGIAQGLGEVMPTPLGGIATDVPNVMVRAAVGNALTQGIGVATGLQNKFDWRGVVAAGAGAGVGQAVGGALGELNAFKDFGAFGQGLAIRTVSSFAGGIVAAAMRGGRVSAMQVAVDAFGNALGDSIAAANSSGGSGTGQGAADFGVPQWRLPAGMGYDVSSSQDILAGWQANAAVQEAVYDGSSLTYNDSPDNWDNMGSLPSVGRAGREASQGAWGIAKSLAGAGASNGEINSVKNQLLYLNPELAGGVQAGQGYYLPGADTPENIGLARASDRVYATQLEARAEAQAQRTAAAAQAATASYETAELNNWATRAPAPMNSGASVNYADVAGPVLTARDRTRLTVDAVNNVADSRDLTRAELQGALTDVRTAIKSAGSNEERLWLQSAALNLHTAGASRSLMSPMETMDSPEMYGLGGASGMFGGSNGPLPSGVRGSTYTGPSNRSAHRPYAISEVDPLKDLIPGQPLPDKLEIVLLGNSNKAGNFILRLGVDDRSIGGVNVPGKSVSIGTDLELKTEFEKMFGFNREMKRGDTLSGAFVEDIRAAGFDVLYAPTARNPFHARIVPGVNNFDQEGRDYLTLAFDRIARQKSGK